tara:strand:+ start:304 stop:555 length:252 start_codon:yes stop_codon:yes gene_type:complete
MCFGSSQPKAPPPAPVLPPPIAPQAPAPARVAVAAPRDLTIDRQKGIKKQQSSKEASGQVSKGTSQLRVPLNIGAPKSGGLNI